MSPARKRFSVAGGTLPSADDAIDVTTPGRQDVTTPRPPRPGARRTAFTWRLTAEEALALDEMTLRLKRQLGRPKLDKAEMLAALVGLAEEQLRGIRRARRTDAVRADVVTSRRLDAGLGGPDLSAKVTAELERRREALAEAIRAAGEASSPAAIRPRSRHRLARLPGIANWRRRRQPPPFPPDAWCRPPSRHPVPFRPDGCGRSPLPPACCRRGSAGLGGGFTRGAGAGGRRRGGARGDPDLLPHSGVSERTALLVSLLLPVLVGGHEGDDEPVRLLDRLSLPVDDDGRFGQVGAQRFVGGSGPCRGQVHGLAGVGADSVHGGLHGGGLVPPEGPKTSSGMPGTMRNWHQR